MKVRMNRSLSRALWPTVLAVALFAFASRMALEASLETITLQFGVANDGLEGITAMYLDAVSLKVCNQPSEGSKPSEG